MRGSFSPILFINQNQNLTYVLTLTINNSLYSSYKILKFLSMKAEFINLKSQGIWSTIFK